ncbi:MAG: aminopeptidase P family protein [Coriobacteriia bacterium]|nr:aminopeptidase P family protein [Coriobacteriia bacterium]
MTAPDSTRIETRLAALREALESAGLGASALLANSYNISYMCGMSGLIDAEDPHVALITSDEALLFTDSRYSETARQQSAAAGDLWEVVEFSGARPVSEEIIERLSYCKVGAITLEDTMCYRRYQDWAQHLSDAGIETETSTNLVEGLRRAKDAGEIEAIAAAQAITDEAFSQMLGFMQIGMSELEIASELEYRMRKLGADGLAFPSIVASGPNGAKPHAMPSARTISLGDFVVMDFGAARDGYCSDMTRTVVFGEPSAEARAVYATVLVAQAAGLEAARAGVAGSAVDAAARSVITKAGYGKHFGHGLSHGLGMLVHENPHCSPRSTDTLAPGDVISMEPGVYLPGQFGVRIEDLIAITGDGIRNFTTSAKELIIL